MDRSIQIKAMSGEPRLTILRLLRAPKSHFGHQKSADPAEFGVCMSLIAEALGVAQPTASRHVDILKQAGFIKVKRHLKWSYCTRDNEAIQDYLDWLAQQVAPQS